MSVNYYNLLQVKQNATSKEIEEAYKKLSLEYEAYASLEDKNEIEKRSSGWLNIQTAYNVLSNLANRAKYDEKLETEAITHPSFIAETATIDAIKDNKGCGKLALEILNVMAYCQSYDFPIAILFELIDCNTSFVHLLESAINLLTRCEMIYQERSMLSIDKLTQSNVRLMLKRQGIQKAVLNKVMDLLEVIMKLGDLNVGSHVECVLGYASEHRELDKRCEKIKSLRDNPKQKEKKALLHKAAHSGNLEIVELLVKCGANVKNEDINASLLLAAQEGHLEIVEFLIRNRVDINTRSKNDDTPLLLAAFQGHLEIVEFLIKEKADINAKSKDGNTPLLLAAFQGHLEIVKFLIKERADINAKGKDSCSFLHAAAQEGHLEVVKFLIKSGADVNARGDNGFTPLHLASSRGHLEIVKFLIESRADTHIKGEDGITPLSLAKKNGHKEVLKQLEFSTP